MNRRDHLLELVHGVVEGLNLRSHPCSLFRARAAGFGSHMGLFYSKLCAIGMPLLHVRGLFDAFEVIKKIT